MKRLCILCEDSNAHEFRMRGKSAIGLDIIKYPISESSFEPVTHWFSCLSVTDEGLLKIMNIKNKLGYGIVEESNERDFLKKYNLRKIDNYIDVKPD